MSRDRSSANPAKLQQYATDGMALADVLLLKAIALNDAVTAYNAAAGSHAHVQGDLGELVGDLGGDWRHLDEFAGDVAGSFRLAASIGGEPGDQVFTLPDSYLTQLGQIGYASRDQAIADAEALAADLRHAMGTDDDVSTDDMRAMIARARQGQHDPAFAVAFVTALGIDGLVGLRGLLEETQPRVGRGNSPADRTWSMRNLAPFGLILATAMDTRRDTHGSDRLDFDNTGIPADERLGDGWVDDFVAYDGDRDTSRLFDYSVLVRQSGLPADVLVRIGNHQLDDMLTGEGTAHLELQAANNILHAIGGNDDASFRWSRSDGIRDGTTNLELLLEYRVRPQQGTRYFSVPTDLGGNIAQVVDGALQHPDPRSDELFLTAVDTVAGQESIRYEQLKPVLGDAARTHMDQLAMATTLSDDDRGWDTWPSEDDAVAFLEAIMDDDRATGAVYRGATEFVHGSMAASLREGRPLDAEALGGVAGMVTVADHNVAETASAERMAARQRFADGVSVATRIVSAIPIAGDAADLLSAARTLTSTAATQASAVAARGPDQQLAEDLAEVADLRDSLRQDMRDVTVSYALARGTWTEAEIHAAAQSALGQGGIPQSQVAGMDTDFFADGPAGQGRALKAYDEGMTESRWVELPPDQQAAVMSPNEMMAYEAWIDSPDVRGTLGVRLDRTAASEAMDRVFTDHSAG